MKTWRIRHNRYNRDNGHGTDDDAFVVTSPSIPHSPNRRMRNEPPAAPRRRWWSHLFARRKFRQKHFNLAIILY
jgi:hypothetical protein